MKKNKALKRLTKIEALMSDVTERYSTSASQIQEALQNAKAAVIRAKDAVSLQVSAVAKGAAAAAKAARGGKKTPHAKKTRVKQAAVKAPAVKTLRKNAPIKKVRKKTAVRTTNKSGPIKKSAKKRNAARKTAPIPALAASKAVGPATPDTAEI